MILPVARSLAGRPWVLPALAVDGGGGQFAPRLRPSQIREFEGPKTLGATFSVEATLKVACPLLDDSFCALGTK